MNSEEAKELLPVIQAFAEGKAVEMNWGTEKQPDWRVSKSLNFTSPIDEYRIKPEPRTFWVVRYSDGINLLARYEKPSPSVFGDHEIIKVVEVPQ